MANRKTAAEEIREARENTGPSSTAQTVADKIIEMLKKVLVHDPWHDLTEYEMRQHTRAKWSWQLEREVIAILRSEGFTVVPNPTDHSEGQKVSNSYKVSV